MKTFCNFKVTHQIGARSFVHEFVHNSILFRKATASPSNEGTNVKKKKMVGKKVEEDARSKKKQTNDGHYNEPTRRRTEDLREMIKETATVSTVDEEASWNRVHIVIQNKY